jgi:hypothetical protein
MFPLFSIAGALRRRSAACRRLALGSFLLATSCKESPPTSVESTHANISTEPTRSGEHTDSHATSSENVSTNPPLTALPEHAIALADERVAALRCTTKKSCPQLTASAAKAFCEDLAKKEKRPWRLPTRSELESFSSEVAAPFADSYHWSATPFERDAAQVWIVMPSNPNVSTTYRGEAKKFVTHCVFSRESR